MSSPLRINIFRFTALILTLFCSSAGAQLCKSSKYGSNFFKCIDLPVLNSFLHFTYITQTSKLQIAFRQTNASPSTWAAWAINPTGSTMVGSQAFVAVVQANGSIKAYTSPVTQYNTVLAQGELSFAVDRISATFENGEIAIFATFDLPNKEKIVNHLWQNGPLLNGIPSGHLVRGDNLKSSATLDTLTGRISNSFDPRASRKKTHGILNIVSWSGMMLIGFVMARYLKVSKSADPAWFYLHASCQTIAYIIGLAGFAMGIKLGNESVGIVHKTHRNIGIAIVTLATLQVLALFLRPKPEHKHRILWSIYHSLVGYIVMILSINNVLKGLVILDVAKNKFFAYVIVLATFVIVVMFLEIITTIVVRRRRRREARELENGYAARQRR